MLLHDIICFWPSFQSEGRSENMKITTISLGSVTHSLKAQKLLAGHSIPSKVIKISNDKKGRGCVYGLEIDGIYERSATMILSEYSIQYSLR